MFKFSWKDFEIVISISNWEFQNETRKLTENERAVN